MRMSAGLIVMSAIGSASGITATVQADVWMRPCASVSGTRWTRWPPDSNLSLEYAPCAHDAQDHFLVAAELGRRFGDDLDLPAVALRVARVHAAEAAGEERRLVAAGAGADFEEDVALVVRVPAAAACAAARRRAPRSSRWPRRAPRRRTPSSPDRAPSRWPWPHPLRRAGTRRSARRRARSRSAPG